MKPLIRVAIPQDVPPIAAAMRVRDVEEVKAAGGHSPLVALHLSLQSATYAWTAVDQDGPFAMFGVSPLVSSVGSPWMLGTDRIGLYTKQLLRITAHYVSAMNDRYPVLLNYVDARHTDSLRWLKWSGFQFTGVDLHYGVERRPFIRFSKVR